MVRFPFRIVQEIELNPATAADSIGIQDSTRGTGIEWHGAAGSKLRS